jgi:acetolactate synthase-1/2/3 large subunit
MIETIAAALREARTPIVIARPSAARGRDGALLRELGLRLGVTPVVMESPRGSEDLRYRAQTSRYREADCVLLIGPADFAVHFLRDARIAAEGRVALVDADGDPVPERAPHAHARLMPHEALEALLAALPPEHRRPWIAEPADPDVPRGEGFHPLAAGAVLRDALAAGDIVVLDGGEFCQWLRLALARLPNEIVWNSRLGAIGGSIPLALGIAAAMPNRRVVVAIGDGSFGYHGMEIETAVRERFHLTILVGNDARWAAEWHAQREKFGRDVATVLLPVPYEKVAEAMGALGFEAGDEASLRKALQEALAVRATSCINVRIASERSPASAP